MRNLILSLTVSILLVGCGEDSVVEQPEGSESAETVTVSPAPDTAAAGAPSTEPDAPATNDAEGEPPPSGSGSDEPVTSGAVIPEATRDQKAEPTRREEATDPPVPPTSAPPSARNDLAASYTLSTVDGRGLPAVTDTRPGCQIQVLSGRVDIDGSNRFSLRTGIRETCDGRVTSEESWEASGTVRRSGSALHFAGSSGEAFGTAEGEYSNGTIVIRSIAGEGGEEKVNWRFVSGRG